MLTSKRALAGATAALLAISAVTVAAVPAQAASSWSKPKVVSSKHGLGFATSKDGKVAIWVRANRRSAVGTIRSAVYQAKKGRWTPSEEVPGTIGATDVQISADGNTALVHLGGTGFFVTTRRSGALWGTLTKVTGDGVDPFSNTGALAANGRTLAYTQVVSQRPYAPPSR